ncbi:helix-turn-helix domain-containing protein [Streptomyces jumonjinensis]|uniref:helix-turn-helix domain-containing protein n=1 Tax=Streptomyces jumonjinensis TaxID=1945 RepID=UPI0037A88A0A
MSAEQSSSESPIAPVADLRQSEPNPRARPLAGALRQLREAKGLTLGKAAKAIRSSASKLSRLERAVNPVREQDMWDLVEFYGTPRERWPEFYDLWCQAQPDHGKGPISDVAPDWLHRLITHEQGASRILAFEPLVVVGLLQTADYARDLVRAELGDAIDDMTVERHVLVRKDRWRSFESQKDCVLVAILGEGVLRSLVGSLQVMYEQVTHLRAAADLPHVSIHIIPYDRDGLSRAPSLPVTHLKYDDGGPRELIYVEGLDSAEYITEKERVAKGRSRLESAMDAALQRKGSIALLDEYVAMYERRLGDQEAGSC